MSTLESIKSELQEIIADSNATTGGNATTVRDGVDALIEGYGGGLPTDTLVGLQNGYDVMFYDENNEGLAFYSIKKGHTINPPEYNCKNWQDADGGVIVFPYTPTADVIFYANNNTYASQLYEFYGVDSAICPYVVLYAETKQIAIAFGTTIEYYPENKITLRGTVYRGYRNTTVGISDFSDIESVVNKAMSLVPKNYITSSTSLQVSGNGYYHYTNFENELTIPLGKYRLD